jgi:type I restriction enzyme R subunit
VSVRSPHLELAFEDLIEKHLVDNDWERGTPVTFDRKRGIDFGEMLAFIGATQQAAWDELIVRRGGDRDVAQREFEKLVTKRLEESGTLHALRRGVTDMGIDFRLAYFKPEHGLTPPLVAGYKANRCTVVRQLAYSESDPDKTLDLALLVNGIPTATAELKNPLTGQNVEHAKNQYRRDRDPAEPVFKHALAHFAVDPSLVFLTTRLTGENTAFLPFNQGSEGAGEPGGGGNPPAGGSHHATAYLWEEVWQRDAWLELLHRFLHIEPKAPTAVRRHRRAPAPGKLIFPRFQQWDAVRKLVAEARDRGPGPNYLIQHSAGSGKSNTIAWLAHRLGSLHTEDKKVFDKVVVITDRVVLDRQLQATIFQFDHEPGVVAKVEGTSAQLAEALESSTAKIIVSTLQKFPFVLGKLEDLSEKNFAVIIDEAHSSQSGEAAKALRAALGSAAEIAEGPEEGDVEADEVAEMTMTLVERSARERGPQPNIRFIAFTATPTKRTLTIFGRREEGELHPFHTYSMRQAIEEGFILDVLERFMSYEVFWKVASTLENDPEVERRQAVAEIVRFVSARPETLEEKAKIIVEHFRAAVRKQIGGRAKAMVVTASRELAVRTHFAITTYIRDQGYTDCEALVAFSDAIEVDGESWTEAKINGFGEKQLPQRFAEDPYRILTVAEKYQTGFDQPLLHTMYVDKQLNGLRAVQTLSRLNRTHPDKEDAFVLDFVNSAEEIRTAFRPWYEETSALPTDPNELYSARERVLEFGVTDNKNEAAFVAAFLAGEDGAHAALYAHLEPAKRRFEDLDERARREFHADAAKFCDLYAFLSQGAGFVDPRLEQTYLYLRHLQRVLPRERSERIDLGDSLELTHLRVQKGAETNASLDQGSEPMAPESAEAIVAEPETDSISRIIRDLNERHGLQLGAGDEIVRRIADSLNEDPDLQEAAAVNSFANFELLFEEKFEERAIEARNQSWEFFELAFGNPEIHDQITTTLAREVYARLTSQRSSNDGAPRTRT